MDNESNNLCIEDCPEGYLNLRDTAKELRLSEDYITANITESLRPRFGSDDRPYYNSLEVAAFRLRMNRWR